MNAELIAKRALAREKKIVSAFKIFDHENNNTIDVREVGTVIRSLGLIPSEAELHEIISECEDGVDTMETTETMGTNPNNPNGQDGSVTSVVKLEKFVPTVMAIMNSGKMKPATEELLLQAFQVLDSNDQGFLTDSEITDYMTKEGEPFSQDEMNEMLEACVDRESGNLLYKNFLNQLVFEESI